MVRRSCSLSDDDEYEIPDIPKTVEPKRNGLDEEEEPSDDEKAKVPGSKPKTKAEKKKYGDELKGQGMKDETLDDPLAEKMRRQRLVEESDFELAQEAFGGAAALDLDKFIPKSQGEFEMYAKVVASKLLKPYERSAHYMNMMKALLRATTSFMDASEAKELETAMGVIRNEKVKAEKPVAKSKKAAKKATLNMTRGDIDDGDLMALTEAARYRNEVLDDDYDFM